MNKSTINRIKRLARGVCTDAQREVYVHYMDQLVNIQEIVSAATDAQIVKDIRHFCAITLPNNAELTALYNFLEG